MVCMDLRHGTELSERNAHRIQCLPMRVQGCFIWAFGYLIGEEGIFRRKGKKNVSIRGTVWSGFVLVYVEFMDFSPACYLFLYLCASLLGDPPRNSTHYTPILAKSPLPSNSRVEEPTV